MLRVGIRDRYSGALAWLRDPSSITGNRVTPRMFTVYSMTQETTPRCQQFGVNLFFTGCGILCIPGDKGESSSQGLRRGCGKPGVWQRFRTISGGMLSYVHRVIIRLFLEMPKNTTGGVVFCGVCGLICECGILSHIRYTPPTSVPA